MALELTAADKEQIHVLIENVAYGFDARDRGDYDIERLQGQLRVSVSPIMTSISGSLWTSMLVVIWIWGENVDPEGPLKDFTPISGGGNDVKTAIQDIKEKLGIEWDRHYGSPIE